MLEQALAAIEEERLAQGNLLGQLNARLAAVTVQGEIKDHDKFNQYLNPFGHALAVKDLQQKLNPTVAKTLVNLFENYKIPEFVWEWLVWEEIQAIAGG